MTYYRIKQEGMIVAGATNEVEAMRYFNLYAEDGPCELQERRGKRYITIARGGEGKGCG